MEEGAQSASPSPADLPQRKLARQLDFTAAAAAAASIHVAIEQPPLPLPVPRPSFTMTALMRPDSSVPRVVPLLEARDGTPKKPKTCNCKNSKCLKLYCECFASGFYCNGCNCLNCYNNIENEASRQEAIEASLDRNPNAFRPKIECSPNAIPDREEAGDAPLVGKHNKGCHCKKSGCLKKYCECFQAGILCSENCKCLDCKNFEGSEERRAISHGDVGNIPTHIQQTNAALNGAIGPSGYGSPPAYKKRKTQEHFIGTISKDQANLRIAQFPHMSRGTNLPPQGSSKGTYRSLLADVVQPKDLKDLCKLLMVASHETAKKGFDHKSQQKPTDREDQMACSLASSSEQRDERPKEIRQESSASGHLTATVAEKMSTEPGSDFTDVQKGGRPMSPGTRALMCDEKDTMFMASQNNNALPRFVHNRDMGEGYAEREGTVLTEFKDCLLKLIACGRDKETSCLSKVTKSEPGNHQEPFVNAATSSEVARTVNAFSSLPSKFLPPKSGRQQHIENGNKKQKEIIDVD